MPPHLRHSFAVVALVSAPVIALAQEDASRIEKRFERPPEPKSTLQPLLIPLPGHVPPEQADQIRFTLKELVLVGNTTFDTGELLPLYANLLGKDITLLDIYRLRDAITAKYGNAGYGLSRALIPEQRIQAEGIVRIEILEGFVDEVIIEGASEDQQAFLAHASKKIRAERPLNARTLERYLLLANDRYAIKVTATMKKSEKTPAASTLILEVEPAPRLEGGASIDNRGTDAVGPLQISGNVSVNGLFGHAAQTSLAYVTSEQPKELQYWSASHTEIVSDEGTALTLSYNISTSRPGTPVLRLLEQKSDSDTWTLKLTHSFIRTRQENLSAHLKYEQKNTTSQSLGTITSEDKTRSVRAGISYDRADAHDGVNQALIEFSAGLRGLGATDQNSTLRSRGDGRVDYRKLTINLSRNQELGYFSDSLSRFALNVALMGQYAGTGLLSSEECGIGGQQFGRAYDSSEILGDRCLAASLELRFTPSVAGTPFRYAQFYGFYDGGSTRNENPLSATDPLTKSLSSAGIGLRFGLPGNITGSIEATQPLTRSVANEGNKSARIFGNLGVRF
ncbi:MAG: ShlB/FhaC/HecB family hemolysin secretion/activation protein [Sulfuritalea sp.]|nr:ShlB/FhaC/HecB family hemolysin secretion/activation protein [Sulfuritalea sp.]